MAVNTVISPYFSTFSFTKHLCKCYAPQVPTAWSEKLHNSGSQIKSILDPSPTLQQPFFFFSSTCLQASVWGGRQLDSSPDLSQGFSQLIFKVHFHSVLVPHYWDWHDRKHTSNRNFHMSTLCKEQGTQRDHLLLYWAAHVDTYSAKTQTCFQQELTQKSVHITEGGGGGAGLKYHLSLLAASLDQAYKQ